ncbi:hypothetical protein J6590_066309 [Homalodisca vitripennis]|nr:hypothetical protein J6590_066309 [Homalodisca vitripennis]
MPKPKMCYLKEHVSIQRSMVVDGQIASPSVLGVLLVLYWKKDKLEIRGDSYAGTTKLQFHEDSSAGTTSWSFIETVKLELHGDSQAEAASWNFVVTVNLKRQAGVLWRQRIWNDKRNFVETVNLERRAGVSWSSESVKLIK